MFKLNTLDSARSLETVVSPGLDLEEDAGLTRMGRFLARWSLDELPQLWNIAAGQMSLIGPRPVEPPIAASYEPWQYERFQIRPGLTGLWQITARGDGRFMHHHTEVDLAYARHVSLGVDVRILWRTLPVWARLRETSDPLALLAASPDHQPGLRRSIYLGSKRLFDIATSLIALVALSPALLVIALAIRLDSPGPAIFRQPRVGFHGYIFPMLKFRSMHSDADEALHQQHYNNLAVSSSATPIRIPEDPRITRVGKFIRRWSLDELPNLWNVTKGDMSLVGPRPFVPYEVDLHQPEELRRLNAKPGITGLAQIRGRLEMSMAERNAADLEYLDRRSVLFDLHLLAKTFTTVITRPGI
jgi:lipopolysaccharide/colanic/teichoic acid biosynthesis glycosyltransferase